jgi:hypothetical protein
VQTLAAAIAKDAERALRYQIRVGAAMMRFFRREAAAARGNPAIAKARLGAGQLVMAS